MHDVDTRHICYVCRKPLKGLTEKIPLEWYGGHAHGQRDIVPVHEPCVKGKKILQTSERLFWER